MNKLERRLKSKTKFKQRLKKYGISENEIKKDPRAYSCFRTTGKPCSCYMCSPGKYGEERPKYYQKHKNKYNE